jgi:hypothetical protein
MSLVAPHKMLLAVQLYAFPFALPSHPLNKMFR